MNDKPYVVHDVDMADGETAGKLAKAIGTIPQSTKELSDIIKELKACHAHRRAAAHA